MLYKNIKSFYVEQGDGPKQELKKLHSEKHIFVLFI